MPRSTRDRPAKTPLSEEAVIDAALEVLRAEGLDAVTMRRVAAALDTGPASLYVYVRGRDELREAMLDRVVGAVATEPPDPGRWRAQLHALLGTLLRALEAHPGLASAALGRPPTSERSLAVTENMLGLLLAGGIARQDAAWACDILPLLTVAAATETDARRAQGLTSPEDQVRVASGLRDTFAALPGERFPLIVGSVAELAAGDGDDRFVFGVDVFVDGLLARSGRS